MGADPSQSQAGGAVGGNKVGALRAVGEVNIRLYTSSFCGACTSTRAIVDQAVALVSAARVTEVNVAFHPEEAELASITATPTIVLENAAGEVVFRAEGVPTLNQVLTGLALAV